MSKPEPSRRLRGGDVLADALVTELLGKRLVATLATIGVDGAPHVVPMWFAVEGGRIVLAASSSSRKVRNLERDSRATFAVHDSRPGFEVCGATIAGRVELVTGAAAGPLVALVHRRYLTEEGRALPEAAAFLAGDDVALQLTPLSASTWDQRATTPSAVLRQAGGALPLESTDPARGVG